MVVLLLLTGVVAKEEATGSRWKYLMLRLTARCLKVKTSRTSCCCYTSSLEGRDEQLDIPIVFGVKHVAVIVDVVVVVFVSCFVEFVSEFLVLVKMIFVEAVRDYCC